MSKYWLFSECRMENLQSVFIQLVHKTERKVIIKRGKTAKGYWTYCNEVGCDVWGILTSMDSICGEPVCLTLTERYIKPGTSTYVQGVEVGVDYNGVVPGLLFCFLYGIITVTNRNLYEDK